jgi:hypothetical protein
VSIPVYSSANPPVCPSSQPFSLHLFPSSACLPTDPPICPASQSSSLSVCQFLRISSCQSFRVSSCQSLRLSSCQYLQPFLLKILQSFPSYYFSILSSSQSSFVLCLPSLFPNLKRMCSWFPFVFVPRLIWKI